MTASLIAMHARAEEEDDTPLEKRRFSSAPTGSTFYVGGDGFSLEMLKDNNSKGTSSNNNKNDQNGSKISPDAIFLNTGAWFEISNNLGVFSKVVLTMAKFSETLYLVPSIDGLELKVINSAKSAYTIAQFTTLFFHDYDITQLNTQEKNLVRFSMKSAIALFKSSSVEKQSINCTLRLDPESDFMVVDFWQNYDCAKTHKIPLREGGEDTFGKMRENRNQMANVMVMPAKSLLNYIGQMGTDTVDLIIKAKPDEFSLHKCIPEEQDRQKEKKTEAKLDIGLFESYAVLRPVEFTVSLKELKAAVNLADQLGISVSLYFDEPNQPVIVSLEARVEFNVDFILSTTETSERPASMTMVAAALLQDVAKERESISSNSQQQQIQPLKKPYKRVELNSQQDLRVPVTQYAEKLPPRMRTPPEPEAEEPQFGYADQPNFPQENLDPAMFRTPPQDQQQLPPDVINRRHAPNYFEVDFTPTQSQEDEEEDEGAMPEKRFKHYFLNVSQQTQDAKEVFKDKVVIVEESDLED